MSILQDLRFACRILLKSPGTTVPILIKLALGIGATTSMFSVINAILLRPLPYKHPDRLVAIWQRGVASAVRPLGRRL
jgi:putative ABC transport system permease protein